MAASPHDDEKKSKEAEAPSDNSKPSGVNFSGQWELVSNEGLDEFMKAEGIGYLKRKLMAMASITLNIEHSGNVMRVNAKLPIGEVKEEINLDGSEKATKNPMGDDIKISAKWKDDTHQILEVRTLKVQTKRTTTMERSMPNVNQLRDVMTNVDGLKMVRMFKRKL